MLRVDAGNAGLPVGYDNPAEVGADRLVNGVAAVRMYGGAGRPIVVVDFGNRDHVRRDLGRRRVSRRRDLSGRRDLGRRPLSAGPAQLPRVEVRKPAAVIGRSTVASMQSGLFFGYVAMVEGIVRRLRDEIERGDGLVCIGTGGLAGDIAAETSLIDHVQPDLTLAGLRFVWERIREGGGVG